MENNNDQIVFNNLVKKNRLIFVFVFAANIIMALFVEVVQRVLQMYFVDMSTNEIMNGFSYIIPFAIGIIIAIVFYQSSKPVIVNSEGIRNKGILHKWGDISKIEVKEHYLYIISRSFVKIHCATIDKEKFYNAVMQFSNSQVTFINDSNDTSYMYYKQEVLDKIFTRNNIITMILLVAALLIIFYTTDYIFFAGWILFAIYYDIFNKYYLSYFDNRGIKISNKMYEWKHISNIYVKEDIGVKSLCVNYQNREKVILKDIARLDITEEELLQRANAYIAKEEKPYTAPKSKKFKNAMIAIGLILVLLVIIAVAMDDTGSEKYDINIPVEPGYEVYINNNVGIGFKYSYMWEQLTSEDIEDFMEGNADGVLGIFMYEGTFNNLIVIYEKVFSNMTASKYANLQKEIFKRDKDLSQMELINEGTIRYGDNEAYQIMYKWDHGDIYGTTGIQIYVYFVENRKVYAFIYTIMYEEDYEDSKGQFENMLNSLVVM